MSTTATAAAWSKLLREAAAASRIAEYLARGQQNRIGFNTIAKQLLPVGELLVRWYADSRAGRV
jgi:hypothetical protein